MNGHSHSPSFKTDLITFFLSLSSSHIISGLLAAEAFSIQASHCKNPSQE